MEKIQNTNYYLPFRTAALEPYGNKAKNALLPAGRFQKPGGSQAILSQLLVKLAEIFGEQTLAIQNSAVNQTIPENWASIVDYLKQSGIIDGLYFKPIFCDELILFNAYISSSFNSAGVKTDGVQPRHNVFAHGRAQNHEEAISKCIGEFLERFPLLIYKEKDYLRASMRDLRKKRERYIEIGRLSKYSEEQKLANRRFGFDDNSVFYWSEAESLFVGEAALIPTQCIFWNYNFRHQGWTEPVLGERNTNGAGGHFTKEEAIVAGIYELIQRDGLLIYWLNHLAPPRILNESITNLETRNFMEECRRMNFEVIFCDTTTDIGVPSCLCFLIDQSGVGPKLSLGGGCDLSWDKALYQSLIEAAGIYHWTRDRWEAGVNKTLNLENYTSDKSAEIDQVGRIDLWADAANFKNFQFFISENTVSLDDLKKKEIRLNNSNEVLPRLIEIFKAMGADYEIFYYQAKHKILDDLGYCSVKVIIPPLISLYLNEIYAPLGAKRLKEVPEKLGFKPAKEWNPWPHPFP